MSMTIEARQEVEKLLRSGERLKAIQYLNNTFNISLEDAAMLVEALEGEIDLTPTVVPVPTLIHSSTTLDGPLKTAVAQMLRTGNKVEAVKHVRSHLHVGLKEALVMVEEVAKEINPNYVSFNIGGCLQTILKGVGIFLMIASVIFMAAAAIIYFVQSQSVRNSDLVTGVVTEMKSLNTGGSAPVIEYEWKGKKQSYESNYYTSPPDYQVGQTVSLYVHREEPGEIVLDTFADRYAIIVGLGVIGGGLFLISLVFLYFGRRKF